MCEMDNLQLIDFSKEDDCLLEFSFRDSVKDVRLSRAGYNSILLAFGLFVHVPCEYLCFVVELVLQ